jgi:cytochrome b involved in lipid metabolism
MKYYSQYDISNMRKNNRIILIRKNTVYDVTNFIKDHPGGKNSIIKNHYKDNQINYNYHSNQAKKLWEKYKIGYLITKKNNSCQIL